MDAEPSGITRVERILAYMVAGVVAVSILCFFAVLIGGLMGQAAAQAAGTGPWVLVIMFPYFGLPLGMVLVIALVIVSSIRRKRDIQQRS